MIGVKNYEKVHTVRSPRSFLTATRGSWHSAKCYETFRDELKKIQQFYKPDRAIVRPGRLSRTMFLS